jgi:hypothetical protein
MGMKEEDKSDPFDLENLVVEPAPKPAPKPRKPARPKFAMVPLSLIPILAGSGEAAILLAIYLLHQDWKTKGEAITLSNVALEGSGLTRLQKYRALRRLGKLGLVVVERRGKASPRVEWVVPVSKLNM